ncbi:hypothetical protein L8106_22671, partial [Lyngbya sp. PCC 8106]
MVGAKRYGNPESDLPKDFEVQRQVIIKLWGSPLMLKLLLVTYSR